MELSDVPKVHIIIIMGVSGSGKSTIGKLLANDLGWIFYEGDEFHSHKNIKKMRKGVPLTDTDREPWLLKLKQLIRHLIATSQQAIIACSALKQAYREYLTENDSKIAFVYLKGDEHELRKRLELRNSHFMKADLLVSQIKTLEEPEKALTLNFTDSPHSLIHSIKEAFNL